MLEYLEVSTHSEVDSAVIWLHGLGADGHDFESIVDELPLAPHLGIRFIFPHAPVQAVTINGGMRMRAWYDIRESELQRIPDLEGIRNSGDMLEELIKEQIQKGISADRIVLAGFSQGGVIAFHLGLQGIYPFAGILALSTYCPTLDEILHPGTTRFPPVFMGHGSYDPVVPMELAQAVLGKLRDKKVEVEWNDYPMPHSVCQQELNHLGLFINRVLGIRE